MISFAVRDLDHLLSVYGYWAVLVFVGVESLGIPLPGETMLIAAALYAGATHHLSILFVVLAAIGGAIGGDNTGYAIGRYGGWPLLVRYGRYIGFGEGRIKLARYLFLLHGGKVVFFGRFVSVLRTYAALFAGITRMAWWRFFGFNAAGGILWSVVYGTAAYLLGSEIDRLARPVELVIGIGAGLVIVAFLVFLRRDVARLEREAQLAFPGPLVERAVAPEGSRGS